MIISSIVHYTFFAPHKKLEPETQSPSPIHHALGALAAASTKLTPIQSAPMIQKAFPVGRGWYRNMSAKKMPPRLPNPPTIPDITPWRTNCEVILGERGENIRCERNDNGELD